MRSNPRVERQGALPQVAGYRLERCLGAGGMGIVYEARDLQLGRSVALKMLRRRGPAALSLFKQEFRALASLSHPNLVALYDLCCVDDAWFLTMELIRGSSLREALGLHQLTASVPTVRNAATKADALSEAQTGTRAIGQPSQRIATSETQLRACFAQLACGLLALHDAGKLHRDVKPSNVLVEQGGRVVLADFGLVMDSEPAADDAREDARYGTLGYMPPEQLLGAALRPSSDWYAVGVMLYEALCGRLPFSGTSAANILLAQSARPVAPTDLAPSAPAALAELALALLAYQPEQRPSGEDVLRRLSPERASVRASRERPPPAQHDLALGRTDELLALRRAFARGATQLTIVVGASGVGKTHLLRRFTETLRSESGVMVLRGRCHERESVPYKAFDTIVDELAQTLRSMPEAQRAATMPADVDALTRIFPVLRRALPSRGRPLGGLDAPTLQRRAFAAFRALLDNLSATRRVVLSIDDLQWSDADSVRLLRELLESSSEVPLLIVATARSEDLAQSELLQELLAQDGLAEADDRVRALQLDTLPEPDSRRLAAQLLGDAADAQAVAALARESRGIPYFLHELARHRRRAREGTDVGERDLPATLESLLQGRIEALPGDARTLLALIAVAGRTVERAVLFQALAQWSVDSTAAWQQLAHEHLVRVSASGGSLRVECYHDRVRELVVAALGADVLVHHHRQLAAAIEATGAGDPEQLLVHYQGAGETDRARAYAVRAAHGAFEALAFDRAARLYEAALSIGGHDDGAARTLAVRRGEALAYAGRTREAGEAFAAAAALAEGTQRVELRRLSAQHYLTSGAADQGLPILREALRRVKLPYPASTAATVARLLGERLRIRLGRLKLRERPPQRIAEAERLRLEVCFSAAVGLAMSDVTRSAAFSALHLRLALASGDQARIARGLAFEMGVAPADGGEGLRWAETVALPAAERLAQRTDDIYEGALFSLAQGHVAYLAADWQRALGPLQAAEQRLRELRHVDVRWALQSASV